MTLASEEKHWKPSWFDPLFGLPALGVLTMNMTIIAIVVIVLYQFETHAAAEGQEVKDRILRNQESIVALERELRDVASENRTWNQTEIRNQRTMLKHQVEILKLLKQQDSKKVESLPAPKPE